MVQTTVEGAGATFATSTDAQLVEAAVGGNHLAFDELYRRHAQAAWRLAQAVNRNAEDAADAVSEAFVKVLAAVGAGQLREGATFRSYLLTTTRRCSIDTIRRHGRTRPTDDDSTLDGAAPHATPSERLEGGVEAAFVAEAFRDLPERWRSVLWLTEVEGMPPSEAAGVLGLSPNGTAQLAVRARAGLRERFLQAHLRSTDDKACQFTVERLGAYVAGALAPRELAKVDQHLAECEACRARLEELEDLRRPLRLALIPIPLALGGLALERWQGTLTSAAGASGSAAGWLASPPQWARRVLGAAAAAVFVAGAISLPWVDDDGDGTPTRELAAPAVSPADDEDDEEATATPALDAAPEVAADAVGAALAGTAVPAAQPEPDPPAEAPPPAVAPPAVAAESPTPPEEPSGATAEVSVGGRSGDDMLAVQVQVGGDGCSGITAGPQTLGCGPTTVPEEDGLHLHTGGDALPEQTISLP